MNHFINPDLNAFVDEQEELNRAAEEQAGSALKPGDVPPEVLRKLRVYDKNGNIKVKLSDIAHNEQHPLGDRDIVFRVFDIENPIATLIHFHGGGWVMGSIYEQEKYLTEMTLSANIRIVSVDYPLAPETTLPEILETAFNAARLIIDKAEAKPILLGGESAGAHIALSTLLRLRARPEMLKRCVGIYLCYGLYDLSMTPSQRQWGEDFMGLSTPYLEWFYSLAMPGFSEEQRRAPDLSPLFADLANLPSAHFMIGEKDPLLDDTLFMHRRWQAAGNECSLGVYPRAPHGFNGQPSQMAAHCNASISQFLRARVDAESI